MLRPSARPADKLDAFSSICSYCTSLQAQFTCAHSCSLNDRTIFRRSASLIHYSHLLSPLLDHARAEKNFYSDMNLFTVPLVRVEAISRVFRRIKRASSQYKHHFMQ